MSLKYGELFAGYGGLGLGVQSVLGGEMAWCAEFDKAPSKILAHHWPDVPNLGDVTKVDWSQVEPVDVITGGSPCQDLSHAGKRLGMKAGTRSGLWASMCDAIDIIRPSLVVWENVRGALSAEADSALEPCAGCVGDGDDGPVLRALGRVLGDLAELGYDAAWYGLRAADVGAAHGRFRIFVFATPGDAPSAAWESAQPDALQARPVAAAESGESDSAPAHVPGQLTLLPTPAVNDMGAAYTPETWDEWTAKMQAAHGNGNGHGKSLAIEAQRLTVPGGSLVEGGDEFVVGGVAGSVLPLVDGQEVGEVADGFGAEGDVHDSNLAAESAADLTSSGLQFGNGSRLLPTPASRDYKDHRIEVAAHRPHDADNLNRAIAHLLPTPTVSDSNGPGAHGDGGLDLRTTVSLLPTPMVGSTSPASHGQISGQYREQMANALDNWGDYAPAIARWEAVIGRPAPDPTEPGAKGNPRLSPKFVEWLMGLPVGHVTDVGLTRNEQLKALGNGVVPQQAAAATQAFIHDITTKAVAS